MKGINHFMEYFWLAAFFISAAYVGYLLATNEVDGDGLTLILFPVIAGFMFLMRRYVRRKFEKNNP